jgi:hypothetical protein
MRADVFPNDSQVHKDECKRRTPKAFASRTSTPHIQSPTKTAAICLRKVERVLRARRYQCGFAVKYNIARRERDPLLRRRLFRLGHDENFEIVR